MLAPAPPQRSQFETWVLRPEPRDSAALTLICVPYAGGGVTAFHGWAPGLPGYVDLWLLRLPGREVRLREEPFTDLHRLVKEAAAVLAPHLAQPFALFGHSLGALIAFELARELRREHGLEAAHLTVSARHAPQLPSWTPMSHRLSDDDFLTVLDQRFNAVPEVLRTDPEMRALYLPVLRADITMLETYRYQEERALCCPMTALAGAEDPEAREADLMRWQQHTRGGFDCRTVEGGHFFLQSQREDVLEGLNRDLHRALVP